jgi:hypothetical protein
MRLALLALLTLCAVSPAPAEARRHHCNPPGAKSVTRDEHGRVYHAVRHHGRYNDVDDYYTCLYRTGRTHHLGTDFADAIDRVRIASPYVAWAEAESNSQIQGEALVRMDMRSGRTKRLDDFFSGGCCPGEATTLRRFLVTRFGAVVWARYDRYYSDVTAEIKKIDADGRKTLDTGTDIPAHTLDLSRDGHRVHWRNEGRPKSARLR